MKGFLPADLAIVGTSVVLYMYSGYDNATGLRASSFPNRQMWLRHPPPKVRQSILHWSQE